MAGSFDREDLTRLFDELAEELAKTRTRVVPDIPKPPDVAAPTLYKSRFLTIQGASPKHLLAMKLEAGRDRDRNDIEILLEKNGVTTAEAAEQAAGGQLFEEPPCPRLQLTVRKQVPVKSVFHFLRNTHSGLAALGPQSFQRIPDSIAASRTASWLGPRQPTVSDTGGRQGDEGGVTTGCRARNCSAARRMVSARDHSREAASRSMSRYSASGS